MLDPGSQHSLQSQLGDVISLPRHTSRGLHCLLLLWPLPHILAMPNPPAPPTSSLLLLPLPHSCSALLSSRPATTVSRPSFTAGQTQRPSYSVGGWLPNTSPPPSSEQSACKPLRLRAFPRQEADPMFHSSAPTSIHGALGKSFKGQRFLAPSYDNHFFKMSLHSERIQRNHLTLSVELPNHMREEISLPSFWMLNSPQ